ncbi:MAG: serine hydrolase, partial [Shewanella sp.]
MITSVVALLPAYAPLPAYAQSANAIAPQQIESLVDQAVKPVLAEYQIPGTVIGITFAGQRYFYHYGVRSKATGEAVDANTLFEIGSI